MIPTTILNAVAIDIECWRPIRNYEGVYEVSNLGRVRTISSGKIRTGKPHPRGGYFTLTLCRLGLIETAYVHLLVAYAFKGPRPEGQEAMHVDFDKANNRATNLVWGTPAQNSEQHRGEGNHRASVTEAQAREVKKLLHLGKGISQVARELNISRPTVEKIAHGRTWRHLA